MASTDPDPFLRLSAAAQYILGLVDEALEEVGIRAALIGGQAVNCWVEPRLTMDVDLTITAEGASIRAATAKIQERGFRLRRLQDAGAPSGPDFVQLVEEKSAAGLDIQVAKTDFEAGLLARMRTRGGRPLGIASPEDLIVMKLIAGRSKDQGDAFELAQLPGIDWGYVEQWAATWQVEGRLAELRERLAREDSGPP